MVIKDNRFALLYNTSDVAMEAVSGGALNTNTVGTILCRVGKKTVIRAADTEFTDIVAVVGSQQISLSDETVEFRSWQGGEGYIYYEFVLPAIEGAAFLFNSP